MTWSNLTVQVSLLGCVLCDTYDFVIKTSVYKYRTRHRAIKQHLTLSECCFSPLKTSFFLSTKLGIKGGVSSTLQWFLPRAIHGTKSSGPKGPLPSTPTVLRKAGSYPASLCEWKLLNLTGGGKKLRLVWRLGNKDRKWRGDNSQSYIPSKGQSWETGKPWRKMVNSQVIYRVPNKHSWLEEAF